MARRADDASTDQPTTEGRHHHRVGATDNVANAPITSPVYSLVGSDAFTVLASGVTIEGFTVENATGDGMLLGLTHTLCVDADPERVGNHHREHKRLPPAGRVPEPVSPRRAPC